MRPLLLFVILVLFTPKVAASQEANARAELFGGGGLCRMGGDEGSLGRGACVTGGVGFRVVPRTWVGVDVLTAHHERDIAGGPLRGNATAVVGTATFDFGNGAVRGFASGSAGVLDSRISHTFPASGGGVHEFHSNATDFVWGGGGGVKVFVNPRFTLRPQARILFGESTGVMGLLAFLMTAGYQW